MRVALYCHDKPDHLSIRKENRTAHLAHIEQSGLVEMAGPLLNDAQEMCGSLVILTVDTVEQAQDWASNDPYALAGLFASVDIKVWNKVIG